jgi:ADP-heptose:LPS heptosyltransferase
MHCLNLTEPVNLGKTLGILGKGDWLCHDLNAFEIARMAPRGTAKIRDWVPSERPYGIPVRTRSSLIIRSGAIGDLLLLTPVLAAIKKREINNRVSICCFPHHFDLFNGNEDIDELVGYPIALKDAYDYAEVISLENTMECDHTQHATDVFAKALQAYTSMTDYRPVYHLSEAEKAATAKYLFKGRPNLVIHPKASVANRDYPFEQWVEVIRQLEQRGWGILLFGQRGQIPEIPPQYANPFVRDLSRSGLSFRECAAILAQAQAFCGVDSAWSHMCHALDIPAVVLFGPFSWETRTSKAPKTFALTGVGECAPCNWHITAGQQFPPGKPCTKIQKCVVLAAIDPQKIVNKISLLKP